MPRQLDRKVDASTNTITTTLAYPDESKNRKGFNPIDYPDLNFTYHVRVHGEGDSVRIIVDLDKPIPAEFIGQVGFNFELFPNDLFGKAGTSRSQRHLSPPARGPQLPPFRRAAAHSARHWPASLRCA